MTVLAFVLFVGFVMWIRPKTFTFWCDRHKGNFTSRYAYPSACPVCDSHERAVALDK